MTSRVHVVNVGPEPAAAPWRPSARVLLCAWSVVATLAVLQSVLQYALVDALDREWRTALLQFPRWLSWAAVTPAVARLVHRYPLRAPHRVRHGLLHLVVAVLLTLVLEWLWTQLAVLLEPPRVEQPAAAALSAARSVIGPLSRLLSGTVTYTALVALLSAVAAERVNRQSEVQRAALARDLALARVHAIKMQVHPHFLFNTLHTIGVLIEEEPAAARDVVVRLGDLLRGTLSRSDVTEVTLQQELEMLQSYLAIETVRFRDRLTVTWDIDNSLTDIAVPDLILQPLAENAIKHGIGDREGAHTLTVRARRSGEHVLVEVIDDGVGPPDRRTPRLGIGLVTVRDRLRTLYGTPDPLVLDAHAGGGTTARIAVPYRRLAADSSLATATSRSR
ncbi:MAG: histidine kinase [Gemmatimonadaceae bacterium]|jgi:signal transduction histidine kinase|nr:histidine kinase [Gemmatimonadaceae bacterium]